MITFSHSTITRPGPLRGVRPIAWVVVAEVGLLAALSLGAGLGPVGWLAGIAFALALDGLLSAALRRSPGSWPGPADRVTQGRAVLVGGVAASVADGVGLHAPGAALLALASVALALDAVDGHVARRTGTASALGARFDMEVDAVLILVLSVPVAVSYGWWVLAVGAMRYLFVAATWVAPWLGATLPLSLARKTVAAGQGITLVVAWSGVLPQVATQLSLVLALGLLSWSFGRDTVWLWRTDAARLARRAATEGLDLCPR
jgi:phosphatidylglycerophosphate synthase